MRTDLRTITQTIRHLVEGSSIRSTHRLLDTHVTTVLRILNRAGNRAERVLDRYVKNVELSLMEADELFTFVHIKPKKLDWRKHNFQKHGDQFVYLAFCPRTKLVVAHWIGKHTQSEVCEFMAHLKTRLNGQHVTIRTDAWHLYPAAIRYAFGDDATHIPQRKYSSANKYTLPTANGTAGVERFNGSLRTFNRRLPRKCNGFSKKLSMLKAQINLYVCYYNFCWKHRSLKGKTPAMAAGLTDHVWTIEEILRAGRERV